MTATTALGLLAFEFTMPPWWGFILAIVLVIFAILYPVLKRRGVWG